MRNLLGTLGGCLLVACSAPGMVKRTPDAGAGGDGGGGAVDGAGVGGGGAGGGAGAGGSAGAGAGGSGGLGGRGGGAGGTAGMGGGPAVSCMDGERVCDGPTSVRACLSGKPSGPVLEVCAGGDVCNGGRCLAGACADAEMRRTFEGCLFYTLDVDNTAYDDEKTNTVLFGNPGSGMATVKLEARAPGAPWMMLMMATLPPGGVDTFVLRDNHLEGPGLGVALAYRLVSTLPIVAYHVQSDDSDEDSESSGGTILYPVHALGTAYMPVTYPQKANQDRSQVVIVGTSDGTKVTFTPSATASTLAGGGAPAKGPGQSWSFMLNDGDIYQVYSSKVDSDLTGSDITADKPIAVFSGNISTSYGKTGRNIQSADMAHEQVIPVSAWGKSYIGSRLTPQQGSGGIFGVACDTSRTSLWRVLAAEDGTEVTFDSPAGSTGVPAMPVTLNRGAFIEIGVTAPMNGNGGDFFVAGSKPILLAQFPACEPALALAVSAEQLLSDFMFITPPIFDHELAIVRKAGSPVSLDGAVVPDTSFVDAGGGFQVARLTVPPCRAMLGSCGHRLRGTEMGVALRGQDTICGYAFSGGMGVRCVNPGGTAGGTCP